MLVWLVGIWGLLGWIINDILYVWKLWLVSLGWCVVVEVGIEVLNICE